MVRAVVVVLLLMDGMVSLNLCILDGESCCSTSVVVC